MTIFSHLRAKQEAKKKLEEERAARMEQARKEKVRLEKGDVPALLIAAFFNFVIPIVLALGLICWISYALFVRF